MHRSFRLLSILTAAALMAALSFGAAPQKSPKPDAKEGESTFKAKCAGCHGQDASGNTTMGKSMHLRDLRSSEVQSQNDSQLFDIIAKGKNRMPSFEKSLGHDKIHDVVAYLRTLKK